LFTNEEDPTGGDSIILRKTLEKIKDLIDSDISIELFLLKEENEDFNKKLFWEKLATSFKYEINFDYATKFSELREKVRRKEYKKRVRMQTTFEITPNFSIAIGV
jgi:hypothetical protein